MHTGRLLLGAQSPVFLSMLFGELKEGKSPEICLNDECVTPEVFIEFIRFLYTGSYNPKPQSVMFILYLSKLYQVDVLQKCCIDFIINNITIQTAFELCDSALNLGESELVTKCFEFISNQTSGCLDQKNYDITKLSTTFVLEMTKMETLSCSELDLFLFVWKWSESHKHDQILKEILSHVRLPQISQKDLFNFVKPTNLYPLETYLEAIEFSLSPDKFNCKEVRFQPRSNPKQQNQQKQQNQKQNRRKVPVSAVAKTEGTKLIKTVKSYGVPFYVGDVDCDSIEDVIAAAEMFQNALPDIGCMLLSGGLEKFIVVAVVPENKTRTITALEWVNTALSILSGYQATGSDTFAHGEIPANRYAGVFPIKLKDLCRGPIFVLLRAKGLVKEDVSDDDEVYFFNE